MRFHFPPIGLPSPKVALARSEKEYLALCRKLKVSNPGNWMSTEHAHATTHYINSNQGDLAVIVTIQRTDEFTPIQVASLLVHEAVHIWQEVCNRYGETAPAAEQEAYGIQSLAQDLMTQYAERT